MITSEKPAPIQQFDDKDVILHQVETKYQGFFKIAQYQVSHRLFHGGYSKQLSREIFERGDAVVLMPYDPLRDKVILIEQFRPGAMGREQSPWLLEFIAGMFDGDELPTEVAIREAKEEANITVAHHDLEFIMTYLSSPGGTSECLHLYTANVDSANLGGVFGLPEEGEDILVHAIDRQQAMALLAAGKINNASTIIGLQWLALNFSELRQRWIK